MTNIKENINKIRNAVFGKEIRSAIADSIEEMDLEATNANNTANNVNSRQTTLEKQFNEQIKNMTLKDPSSAEIIAMRTSLNGTEYNTAGARVDSIEKNVASIKIEWSSSITDYSQVLIAAMSNAEGKVFVFEAGKEYPFTKQVDINGMKNCTIDFRNASLKDMGHMMDVVKVDPDTQKTTPAGQELNPLGIRFTNFENLTITNLILDSVDMPVSANNYRISHDDVPKKRANICFATGRNLEFINSEFRCGQGTYIQGAYVQGDETRLPNQLEFFMSKMYNVKNIIFKNILYNGKSKTEVFGFGKCKHILFEGIDKQSDNLVSFFKMLQCEDVKINGIDYVNLQDYSLTDISGTNYNIENINATYESGKFLDITNEWGLSGGKLGDFRIKNCNIDADTILFCSVPAYPGIFKDVEIETIDSITVENCVLGHKGTRTRVIDAVNDNLALSNNSANIINLNVNNTTIYNLHFSNQNLRYDKQLVDHTVTINKLKYIVDNEFYKYSDGGSLASFNLFGKSIINSSTFDMNNVRLLLRDGMISGSATAPSAQKELEKSNTYATFRDCSFKNTEINISLHCEFINCKFTNCRFVNFGKQIKNKVKFNSCKFEWDTTDTKSYTGAKTNVAPFYLDKCSELDFIECSFYGTPKTTSGDLFYAIFKTQDCVFNIKNCLFDVWKQATDGTKSRIYTMQLRNKNSDEETRLDLIIDGNTFLNYCVPLKLTGNSKTIEDTTRIMYLVIKNNISKQIVDNYSILIDSTNLYYNLIDLTLKNNEMTKYRENVSNTGISIPSGAIFKHLVNQGNTGITV